MDDRSGGSGRERREALLRGGVRGVRPRRALERRQDARNRSTTRSTLFRAVERELHDDQHGGWREQAEDDWSPVPDDDPRVEVPFNGRKSANAIVHWLEATTALYAENVRRPGQAIARRGARCRPSSPVPRRPRPDPGAVPPRLDAGSRRRAPDVLRAQRRVRLADGAGPADARRRSRLGALPRLSRPHLPPRLRCPARRCVHRRRRSWPWTASRRPGTGCRTSSATSTRPGMEYRGIGRRVGPGGAARRPRRARVHRLLAPAAAACWQA